MNNELKPYGEYKNTEYDWLGGVPKHWQQLTMRSITKLSNERNGVRNDLELLSVYREYGVIKKSSRDDNHNVESQDLSNYKFVDKGYLVLNKMKMWQGSLGVSKYKGIVSPAYIVCKLVGDLNYNYIHYLLRSPKFKTIYNRISYGVRVGQWDMRYDDFKNIKLYIPSLLEQDQIVKYLDFQIAKINKFIKAKRKLISVLKEQKQVVVNEAVTKGINPDAKMKPSGLELIGDIPERWEIKRAKNYLLQIDKRSNDGTEQLLTVSHITGITPRSEKNVTMFMAESTEGYKICEKDMVAVNTMWAWMGALGVSNYNGIISPSYHTYRKKNDDCYDNYYLDNLLRTNGYIYEYYIRSTGIRSSRLRLYPEKFLEIFLVRPPLKEQKQISEYIKQKVESINRGIDRIQQEISLITEYRTRLISDVVTGKVDVRGIVVDDIVEDDTDIEEIDEDEEGGKEVSEGEEE